jgi:hypothetical protein
LNDLSRIPEPIPNDDPALDWLLLNRWAELKRTHAQAVRSLVRFVGRFSRLIALQSDRLGAIERAVDRLDQRLTAIEARQ